MTIRGTDPMIPLREHPFMSRQRNMFQSMEDADRLKVNLRHLLSLDPRAVYIERGDSTIVYYKSPHASVPGVCRLIMAPNGSHRRIGTVGFDPR